MTPFGRTLIVLVLAIPGVCRASDDSPAICRIAVAPQASQPERLAAAELAAYLGRLFPNTHFETGDPASAEGPLVCLGTPQSAPQWAGLLGDRRLDGPESYVVTTAALQGRTCGLIVGADPAGVVYGVYGLLRRLGCGFYLSFDTLPEPAPRRFSVEGWDLADRPLVPTRLVFNWHNFLSGCSTWNLEHWEKWIVQSQKMGYNAVMVHAYGNNPMAGFRLDGLQKPVGYLSSTRVGRDWSTNHVNDVGRLYGGQVFASAVFGADAAIEGTDLERTEAAQRLMAGAFACAEERGVDVYFAVDVDTPSANPQELIKTLPQRARFEIDVADLAWMGQDEGKAWLVNPDSAEGYRFYRAQVEELLRVYPQIDCLVVWHRKSATPWMGFSRESMPQAWQDEYAAEIRRTPEAEGLWHSVHMFAQAKIVRAFRRALDELGRKQVRLAFGSWDFDFLPAAHRFLPRDVPLIPLDWLVLRDQSVFDAAERRDAVAAVAADRPVIPVAWAHHDDGNYVGRPYTPWSNFLDRLDQMKCRSAGYGIIHWTTKPLDLYFTSLVNQVWAGSGNESLQTSCRRMAADLVGPEQAGPFAAYLHEWVTTMPKIGRETGDFFIDHPLENLPEVESDQRARLDLLAAVDQAQVGPAGLEWLAYFAGLEDYILGIYRTEDAFNRAKKEYAAGDPASARATMADCRPEAVIDRYAEASQHGGLTRGEQGLVVSMNTRWLPHYVRFRQMLAMEPVRYNFAPTSHDLLAQSRGVFTFHFGADKSIWQCLGKEETGAEVYTLPPGAAIENAGQVEAIFEEVCRTGLESDQPIVLAMRPILDRGSRRGLAPAPLAAGKYQLTLLMLDPATAGPGKRLFDLALSATGKGNSVVREKLRVDVCELAGGPRRVLKLSWPVELKEPGEIRVDLVPVQGKALISGAVLEPVPDRGGAPR